MRRDPPPPAHAEHITRTLARSIGSPWALAAAIGFVTVWAVLCALGAEWDRGVRMMEQTATGLMFVMLFVLRRSQNKDTLALQIKLDELVASNPLASNRVLHAEEIPEDELRRIRQHFELLDRLSREAGRDHPLTAEEAYRRHAEEQRRIAEDQDSSNRAR